MLQMRHSSYIFFSGLLWFFIGFLLLSKGINLIVYSINDANLASNFSLIEPLSFYTGGKEKSALVLISVALLVGFVKARFVLIKTVKRVVARILSLTIPIKLSQLYSPGYLILLASMVLLGISLRFLPIPQDLRGTIDLTIGAALMNGALLYFRFALEAKRANP